VVDKLRSVPGALDDTGTTEADDRRTKDRLDAAKRLVDWFVVQLINRSAFNATMALVSFEIVANSIDNT